MTGHEFLEFPSSEELVSALAQRIRILLTEAVRTRGAASLLVSGGSTPIPLFARLAESELPWEKVTISLVDERWVEPTTGDSNENLVRRHLLQKKAATARFIPMKSSAPTAAQAEADCAAALLTIPRPYDCLILGMGNDGHTASLFPGDGKLAAAIAPDSEQICMATQAAAVPHERMTLTLAAILNSRQLFLHLQGEEKKKVLARAQENGEGKEMPIRFILRQDATPLAIYWAP
jgi:6-phosphogluconolactonase